MDSRVTAVTRRPDPPPGPQSRLAGILLVVMGIAGGYLLAFGATGGTQPVDTRLADAIAAESAATVPVSTSGVPTDEPVSFPGTILASVEFGRGLVTWPGDGDPIKTRLATDVWDASYDAAQSRIAVTLAEYGSDTLALHVGKLGDLRFVTSGVTGFAWHPTDPSAIAWVEESEDGFDLVRAVVSDSLVVPSQMAVLPDRVRPVAWGSWGYALQGDGGLTTVSPSGAVIANENLQFLAAGSDGRLIVARPAGIPLSSDWAITGPDLADPQAFDRFGDFNDHPTAAAILPRSGRIVLVSNRFGEGSELARIEVLSPDGTLQTVIRSGMIAESIAWAPDETRLAVGGYYYGPTEVRSVVLLAAADGTGSPIDVPFDHQVRPLGIRE